MFVVFNLQYAYEHIPCVAFGYPCVVLLAQGLDALLLHCNFRAGFSELPVYKDVLQDYCDVPLARMRMRCCEGEG